MRAGLAAVTLDARGGGVSAVARLLWRYVQERGDRSSLFTLVPARRAARSLETGPGRRLGFGARIAVAQALGRCEWMLYSHLSLAKVQAFVPRAGRRPYVVFLHGIEAWRALPADLARILASASVRIANSEFTARQTARINPTVGPIVVCPLAMADPPVPASEALPVAVTAETVIIVARMAAGERYKGHDALLEAWPSVRARRPAARLVIVGEGSDVSRLREKSGALGLDAVVTFTGFVSDSVLAGLYARAAVFAMPSRGEGFGLAYLEAMSHGVPCIGSPHDAAAEIIDDGRTGYLVDQTRVNDLADRVVTLLGDESHRRELGERGRRRAHELFSYDRFATRMDQCLQTVVGATVSRVALADGRA